MSDFSTLLAWIGVNYRPYTDWQMTGRKKPISFVISAHVFSMFYCVTHDLSFVYNKNLFDGSCYFELSGSLYWTTNYAYWSDIDDMDRYVNCTIVTGRSYCIGRRILDDLAILSVIRQWCAFQPVNTYSNRALWAAKHLVDSCRRGQDSILGYY